MGDGMNAEAIPVEETLCGGQPMKIQLKGTTNFTKYIPYINMWSVNNNANIKC